MKRLLLFLLVSILSTTTLLGCSLEEEILSSEKQDLYRYNIGDIVELEGWDIIIDDF